MKTYNSKNIVLIIILVISQQFYGQEHYKVSGSIKDAMSGEKLTGVNIIVEGEPIGAVSDDSGLYELSLPKGNYQLEISYLGYRKESLDIDLKNNLKEHIYLNGTEENLEEVIIFQDKNGLSLPKPEVSILKLSSETVKKTPMVFGEPDLLKAILQMPGVCSPGEGSAGFNVRGGSADQNLILLDGSSIYNTSHLFGFFSVFNNDAIKNMKLYKGGIPARYGGRVASVLDINQKKGNSKEIIVNGGIGVISSRLLAEGPLGKKTSFVLGSRASYAHLFLKAADNDNSARFYDFNTNVEHQLNSNNSIALSGYLGKDYFSINEDFENIYGNSVLNLKWDHIFSENLDSEFSLIHSDYHFDLNIYSSGFESTTGISSQNLNYDLNHFLKGNLKMKYGLNSSLYRFNPGEIKPTEEGYGLNYLKIEDKYALETAVYLEAEHKISKRFRINYGLRFSHFSRLGKETQNIYKNDQPVKFNEELQIYEKASPIDTKYYGRGEPIVSYKNWEPRLSLAYNWRNQSIKLGYNRMSQYLHMLSNTISPTPMDLWIPSGIHVKPQLLDQVSAGYYRKFKQNTFSVEVEAFIKQVKNRINYIDGADLIGNPSIEQVLLNGEERAYGLEFLMRKNSGNFTGWIAYTLSKAQQKTPGRTALEPGINNGNWYHANHDRTHDLSITTNYEFSKKLSLSANFNFQTGRATTFPTGYYEYLDIQVPSYGERNASRLPSYHRLDLAATFTPRPDKKKGFRSEWNFGIYNIYNRRNAHSINFKQNRETGINEAVQLSIFGIIPSITYNFKF